MPMMYAMELRARGHECVYFVDASPADKLSRPENHYPDIDYPYPEWIVEHTLPSQLLLLLLPRFFAWLYTRRIRKHAGGAVTCLVLNGFFTALAPYLEKHFKLVTLSHGADLDVWANTAGATQLAQGLRGRSLFKYLPGKLSTLLIRQFVSMQYRGYSRSDVVVYFPRGLNAAGDRIVEQLVHDGGRYVPRYDISFEPLRHETRDFKDDKGPLTIFSGVRFLFESFPDGNTEYSKGNDIIIAGLAAYYRSHQDLRIHFVEKGEDVQRARQLCRDYGLEPAITWHKEMTFKEMLSLYRAADVCFDQVGPNWIGAIGGYALWLGKPLIANDSKLVSTGLWPADNPVCSASSADEVAEWLERLEDPALRRSISERSKVFVEANMGPALAVDRIFSS